MSNLPASEGTPPEGPAPEGPAPDRPAGAARPMGESAVRAIYDVIHRRRDVRQGFLPDPVPEGTLARLL
ncbi:MAG: hypothetical protein AAFR54_08770, partial [Planctomycetota bacterium]